MARQRICSPFLSMDVFRGHPEISSFFNWMLPNELAVVTSETANYYEKTQANFCAKARLYKALFGFLLFAVGLYFISNPADIFLNNVVSEDYLREKGWKQTYETEERAKVIQHEMEKIQAELERAETSKGGTIDNKMLSASMKLIGSLIIGPGAMYALDTASGMFGDSSLAEKTKKPVDTVNVEFNYQQTEMLRNELDRQEREHLAKIKKLGTPSHAVLLPLILYGFLLLTLGLWSLFRIKSSTYDEAVSYSMLALGICALQLLALGLAGLLLPAADEAEGVTINQNFVQWITIVTGIIGLGWFAVFIESTSHSGFEPGKHSSV